MKKRIFSGAQPTGDLHIGNYLGALKNWVELQDQYESFYCIVNLHAITLPQDPKVLRQKTLDLARIYLAAGVDPEKSTIFIQSDVPEHTELTWVLSCIARMGELERMTQFKDKSKKPPDWSRFLSKLPASPISERIHRATREDSEQILITQKELMSLHQVLRELPADLETQDEVASLTLSISKDGFFLNKAPNPRLGLFTYPVLMAADILLYQTDLVPVGRDQKQHLELTRDLAERFNRDFGETFKVPDPYIPPVGANILSLQDPAKKMSKSDENPNASIFLLDEPDTIVKKFKRAVTDSGTDITFDETRPAIKNLLTIYLLLSGKTTDECIAHFDGKGYGQLKSELAEVTIEFLRPFQERVRHFDDQTLNSILKPGAEKARSIAAETLKTVYRNVGIA